MSQKQLGLIIGLDKGAMSLIENNKRTPSFEIMVRIARALRCSLDDFADGMEENCIIQITVIPWDKVKKMMPTELKKASPKRRR